MHTHPPLLMPHSQCYYVRMRRKSILLVAAFLAIAVAESGNADSSSFLAKSDSGRRTILLFGASWCAPCIGEIRNISKLATAARPDHLVIVWSDSGIKRLAIPHYDNVEIASDSRVEQLTGLYASGSAGLPYSVMIDGRKRKCAEWRAPLLPDSVAQLRAACSLSSKPD